MEVRLTEHPPYAVAPQPRSLGPAGERVALLHAGLWLQIEVAEWGLVREGHLHLACSPVSARRGERWKRVELGSHPMTVVDDGPNLPRDAEDLLRQELGVLELDLFRQADLGLASQIGETRSSFQRRVLRSLHPLVQEKVGRGQPDPRRTSRPAPGRGEIAGALSGLAAGVEHTVVRATEEVIRSVELGLLLVPEGVVLVAGGTEDRMVTGSPRPERRR